MPTSITPEEIKAIRNRYGLSQKSFALLLGIGPASMVRYEAGATPSKANANLIRAARNPQFMGECLAADGHLVPERQRAFAQSVVYDYISLDPAEDARMHAGLPAPGTSALPCTMSMDEAYHYTLQQEILNEQAANLIGRLIAIKVAVGADRFDPALEALLEQLALLKPTIISDEMLNDVALANVRGFLACAEAVLKREREVAQ